MSADHNTSGPSAEISTRVEPGKDDTWLWVGSVVTRRANGELASYVSRWGATGYDTEDDARAAAEDWRNGYVAGTAHAVPGLGDLREPDPLAHAAQRLDELADLCRRVLDGLEDI